jgi:8-oxo-dGTP diphosphatase
MTQLEQKYPHLFNEVIWPWGPTQARFVLLDEVPPAEKISNVNIVPRFGDGWVVLRLANGSYDIAGGTLEPGETYLQTLQRELLEEAGAELVSFHIIGAWDCLSNAGKPYRPHLPFPEYYRLVGFGQIKIINVPENPVGAEQIGAVECVSLDQAVANFLSCNRHDLAELYRLVADLESV